MTKTISNKSLMIQNAIVWASTIIATALILTRTDISDSLSFYILLIQIGGWFANTIALRRA